MSSDLFSKLRCELLTNCMLVIYSNNENKHLVESKAKLRLKHYIKRKLAEPNMKPLKKELQQIKTLLNKDADFIETLNRAHEECLSIVGARKDVDRLFYTMKYLESAGKFDFKLLPDDGRLDDDVIYTSEDVIGTCFDDNDTLVMPVKFTSKMDVLERFKMLLDKEKEFKVVEHKTIDKLHHIYIDLVFR